jgi:putative transposase
MGGLLREGKQVRFRFIEAQKAFHSVAALCRNLQVRSSGFYAWRRRPLSRRARANGAALVHIRAIYRRHKKNYGSPRVRRELAAEGIHLGRHRVARLMREEGLRARAARRFRTTTNSRHSFPVAKNLLARQFEWDRPNQAWATDITYLWTDEGWLYLSAMLDLFGRRVVAWGVSETLEASASCAVLKRAIATRKPPAGLIHHSDRGVQYASDDYQRILRRHGITCSMSRKGNCWDNAPTESFFATLKREIGEIRWPSRAAATDAIAAYVDYYNHVRRHSLLDYVSPVQYEMRESDQRAA